MLGIDRLIMKKITLLQRFSILSLISLVFVSIALGWVMTYNLEQDTLLRSKKMTAKIISEEAGKEFSIDSIDEITTLKIDNYEDFSKKMRHLTLGPDILRIKVWNKDMVVVWSDDRRLVGKSFPDNGELKEALEGEIASELSHLGKTEHEFEREYKTLLELYVPVRSANGKIESVFEVYQNLDPLYAEINRQKLIIWLSTTIGFIFLYLMLFGIVRNASKRIEDQIGIIIRSKEELKEYQNTLNKRFPKGPGSLRRQKLRPMMQAVQNRISLQTCLMSLGLLSIQS